LFSSSWPSPNSLFLYKRLFFPFGHFALPMLSRSVWGTRSLWRQSQRGFLPIYGKGLIGSGSKYAEDRESSKWANADLQAPKDERDFPVNIGGQELRLLELSRQGRLNEVELLLQKATLSHHTVALQIARAFAHQGRSAQVILVQGRSPFKKEGFEEVCSFLPACGRVLITKQILFESYTRQGDAQKAKEQFESLQGNVMPSLTSQFLALVGKELGIDAMVNLTKQYGLQPSMEVHDSHVDTLLRDGKVQEAEEYLNFVRSLGSEPDARLLNKFIVHSVIQGDLQRAEDILVREGSK
jgi:hypothetical protein